MKIFMVISVMMFLVCIGCLVVAGKEHVLISVIGYACLAIVICREIKLIKMKKK
nr:MAG TPA: hypothetical protein [Caudoviricetes sp.]